MRKREVLSCLNQQMAHHQKNVTNIKRDLKRLPGMNMKDATYLVSLEEQVREEDLAFRSPTRTSTEYKGSLTDAIKKAEKDFSDESGVVLERVAQIPIRYTVQIKIGKRFYYMPNKHYLEDFIKH